MTAKPRIQVSAGFRGLPLLMLLAGCSLAPPYQRPTAPVARIFDLDRSASTAVAVPADRLDWQRFFAAPGLRRLLQLAVANNRDLRIAAQRVEEAGAQHRIRKADRLPSVSAGLSASRLHIPAGLSPTDADMNVTAYSATLAPSGWEIDFWGRVRGLETAALESFLATVEAKRAIEVSLIAQIAETYLLERELDERLASVRHTLASREESCRIMTRRHEVGSISKLDLTQAETLRDQARAELSGLERQKERVHNALSLLVGAPLPPESEPLPDIDSTFEPDIGQGLPSEVLLNRPDVLAAEHRLKAANANVGAARAAFFPRITLLAGLGSANSELDGLFHAGTQLWLFVPSISLPLFDGGHNQANLSLAEIRKNIAVANYERTIQGAFREVADALADRRWLGGQIAVQQSIVATQTERKRLALLRYRSGAASFLEVLDAERAQFAAEQALVQTRRDRLATTVSLFAALGGGNAGVLTIDSNRYSGTGHE